MQDKWRNTELNVSLYWQDFLALPLKNGLCCPCHGRRSDCFCSVPILQLLSTCFFLTNWWNLRLSGKIHLPHSDNQSRSPHRHGKRSGKRAEKNWREAWKSKRLGSRVKSHVMWKFRREFVEHSNEGCHFEL